MYILHFPFLDIAESKLRPVVVVSRPYGSHAVVAVVPISSKMKSEPVDSSLSDWKEAGLLKPSTARTHRLTTVLQSKLTRQLGSISANDVIRLNESLRKFLEL